MFIKLCFGIFFNFCTALECIILTVVSFYSSGYESDSVSSTAGFTQERAAPSRPKDQNQSLLDKLTQEKLDSKAKPGTKRNDLSSGITGTTPHTHPYFFVSVFFVCLCIGCFS